MKQAYVYFNPNHETPVLPKLNAEEMKLQANIFMETFASTLRVASFSELTQADIGLAFTTFSLVPVNTKVNLNDYQRIKLFCRCSNIKEVSDKHFFRTRKITFENYDQDAVFL
jgi:hypothetical protein